MPPPPPPPPPLAAAAATAVGMSAPPLVHGFSGPFRSLDPPPLAAAAATAVGISAPPLVHGFFGPFRSLVPPPAAAAARAPKPKKVRLPKATRLSLLKDEHRAIARDCKKYGGAFIVEGPSDLRGFERLDEVLVEFGEMLGMKGWRVLRKVVKAKGCTVVTKIVRVFEEEGVTWHALVDWDAQEEKAELDEKAFQWDESTEDLEGSLGKKKKVKGKKKKKKVPYYPKPIDLKNALLSADSPWQDFMHFLRRNGVIGPAPPGWSKSEPIEVSDEEDEDSDGEDKDSDGDWDGEEGEGESESEEKEEAESPDPDQDGSDRSGEDEEAAEEGEREGDR
uniref:Uncharacterized protein n=1 Tax=Chromera velia CCMP2878 TaxID=1169474 RepID=A0A0G4HCE6_9ALVE|eukprot:Cvel_6310.t1-p1 / transcript=Cvel_6310.t1 / gene=Cvel_6310 / organism=Chromera_velia_CCMP2878 / gene_product=hypothetical protein / transcript_product=hypothetical protein / location=Cvel_scaffold306:38101-39102(-) / protein_length=334 / sequence_SO=supercontig / SO=protein_coding / is_pseudo=false